MIRKIDPLISLPAADLVRAVAFYTEVLGLRTLYENPETGFYIFRAPEGETLLGLHRYTKPLPEPDSDRLFIWISVDDIEEARRKMAARGVRFFGETTFLGPGYEAPFVDTEGNVLRLYEALQRLRRSVVINAPPAKIFPALTDARAIEAWFSAIQNVRLEPRVGGRIAFHDPLFGDVEGQVVELASDRKIGFEFVRNWPTYLEIELIAEGDRTRVEVRQSGFEAVRDRDYNIGKLVWALEAALERLPEQVGAA